MKAASNSYAYTKVCKNLVLTVEYIYQTKMKTYPNSDTGKHGHTVAL